MAVLQAFLKCQLENRCSSNENYVCKQSSLFGISLKAGKLTDAHARTRIDLMFAEEEI